MEFGKDIEIILEGIRKNSILLSKEHKKEYLKLKDSLKYYRIPVIIISSVNSIISVSQQFIPQNIITATNSTLALFCGIIGSIELFLGINNKMEIELNSSKDYYILSCDIYKVLNLDINNRPNGKVFLEECYSRYIKLFETSCLLKKRVEDSLTKIEIIRFARKNSFDSVYSVSSYNETDKTSETEKDKINKVEKNKINKAEKDKINKVEQNKTNETVKNKTNEAEKDKTNDAAKNKTNEAEKDNINEAEKDNINEAEKDNINEAEKDNINEAEKDTSAIIDINEKDKAENKTEGEDNI